MKLNLGLSYIRRLGARLMSVMCFHHSEYRQMAVCLSVDLLWIEDAGRGATIMVGHLGRDMV